MKNKQIDLSDEKIGKEEDAKEEAVLDLRGKEAKGEELIEAQPLDLRQEKTEASLQTGNEEGQEESEDPAGAVVAESEQIKTTEEAVEQEAGEENIKETEARDNESEENEHKKSFLARMTKKKEVKKTEEETDGKVDDEVAEILKEEKEIKEKLEKLEDRLEDIEERRLPKEKSNEEEDISEKSYTKALKKRVFGKKKTNDEDRIKNIEDVEREESVEEKIEPEEVEVESLMVNKRAKNKSAYAEATADREKELPKEILGFPDDFLWGTSTSAYQVEGGIVNDWNLWEKRGRRILNLQRQGKQPSEFICGKAVDSYNQWEKDLILAKKLNTNAIRFGLEWSRIEPKPNNWNIEAIEHYRAVASGAKKRKMKTFVTLWHWTLPTWVARQGGWSNKNTVTLFLRYVDLVIKEIGGSIDYWVVLNEPMVHVYNGYLFGKFPPGRKNIFKAMQAYKNLVKAHKGAYKLIHEHFPNARVSITKLHNFYEPAHRMNPLENALAWLFDYISNQAMLNKLKKQLDYIGFDYYFHDRVVWYPPFIKNKNLETTDIGWEIYPYGIYQGLKKLSKLKKPIYILENGLADAKDEKRVNFIKDHLSFVHQAIEEGVDVRGYFHWSLLDNFEWDKGFEPKFGLYEVDRATMERKPRPSALEYARICKTNKVEIEE